jgi:hypothetical protein
MVKLDSIIPYILVLVVASMLVGTFFLVSEKLKTNSVNDQTYYTSAGYVNTPINSSANLTVLPGVRDWTCFNDTGTDAAELKSVLVLYNALDPTSDSYIGIGAIAYDSMSFNCSINATDFGGSPTYMSMNKTEVSVGEFSNWFEMLVVVLMASLILGIVVVLFAARRAM